MVILNVILIEYVGKDEKKSNLVIYAGFSGYTFRDLTDDMPSIKNHWVKENIQFAAVYTGYLGSTKQIEYVEDIYKDTAKGNGGLLIVDPAMAEEENHWYGAKFEPVLGKLIEML